MSGVPLLEIKNSGDIGRNSFKINKVRRHFLKAKCFTGGKLEAWLSVPTVTEGHGTRGILNVVAKANGNVPAAVKTSHINVLITAH